MGKKRDTSRILDVFFGGVIAAVIATIISDIFVPMILAEKPGQETIDIKVSVEDYNLEFFVANKSTYIVDFYRAVLVFKDSSSLEAFPELSAIYGESRKEPRHGLEGFGDVEVKIFQTLSPNERDRFLIDLSIPIMADDLLSVSLVDSENNRYEAELTWR